MKLARLILLLSLLVLSAVAATVSPLGARGYAVLPQPQRVTLSSPDFRLGPGWSLQRKGVSADNIAVTSYTEGLSSRFHITPPRAAQGGSIVALALAPDSITIGEPLDSNKQAIAEQAYKMDLAPTSITITPNAPAGLFYGVQTLLQLIYPRDGAVLKD